MLTINGPGIIQRPLSPRADKSGFVEVASVQRRFINLMSDVGLGLVSDDSRFKLVSNLPSVGGYPKQHKPKSSVSALLLVPQHLHLGGMSFWHTSHRSRLDSTP